MTAWWICHAAYYIRWVYSVWRWRRWFDGYAMLLTTIGGYMLNLPTVTHTCMRTNPNRVCNRCHKKMAKRYLAVAKQIIRFAVSLATTLEAEKQIGWNEKNKSCDVQVSLNFRWNVILCFGVDALSNFVDSRWFPLMFHNLLMISDCLISLYGITKQVHPLMYLEPMFYSLLLRIGLMLLNCHECS